jgi:hypothetical protein
MTPSPPPSTPAFVQPAPAPVRYGLDDAMLGMPLNAWRTRHPTAKACAASPGGHVSTCVSDPLPISGGYVARSLTYRFVDQQLVQITFQTSINGFSDVMAMLHHTYGQPSKIVRDLAALKDHAVFPHVLMTWRNGRSTIRLSDPVPPGAMLSVRYRLNAADPKVLDALDTSKAASS